MIILQAPPGTIAYQILRAVHLYWPVPFQNQFDVDPERDHHRPDLFLPDWTSISPDKSADLTSLMDRPSLVLTANVSIIPDEIRNQINPDKLFTVQLDSTEKQIQAAFCHCITDPFQTFDYAVPNQDLDAYHQRLWEQLSGRLQLEQETAPGRLLRYEHADADTDFDAFLDEIAIEFDLDPPESDLPLIDKPTIGGIMNQALASCTEYASRYVIFRDICQQILAGGSDYAATWQNLGAETKSEFKTLMAFCFDKSTYWDWQVRS